MFGQCGIVSYSNTGVPLHGLPITNILLSGICITRIQCSHVLLHVSHVLHIKKVYSKLPITKLLKLPPQLIQAIMNQICSV